MKKILKVLKLAGIIFLLSGIACIIIKACSPEYIDSAGILHEAFFLLPIGFGALFLGLVLLVIFLCLAIYHRRKCTNTGQC